VTSPRIKLWPTTISVRLTVHQQRVYIFFSTVCRPHFRHENEHGDRCQSATYTLAALKSDELGKNLV